MTTVFLSPHPDDAALSCGGLITLLSAGGARITIVSVFSGAGPSPRLTPYQRLALGFGGEEPGVDPLAGSAPVDSYAPEPTPSGVMAFRRSEDKAYAHFAGASIEFVDLPDAVFRGYEGDTQLMAPPRPDDPPPTDDLRRVLARLRPTALYAPLSIGGHVDHRQVRRAAMALLAEPASPYLDRTLFYEDFPYAPNIGFERLDQLDPEIAGSLRPGLVFEPEYVEIGPVIDRKLEGLHAYESQLGRLFGPGADRLPAAVRDHASRVGELGGVGPAERYWRVTAGGRPPAC
jgi:LmbE family N-acetylglucosaminyl deacetylase